MTTIPEKLWGIHMPREVGNQPIEGGFVGMGYMDFPSFEELPQTRRDLKTKIQETMPNAKPGAIPVWAGVILRFLNEVSIGDGVIYPSKHDRLVNLGIVESNYEFHPEAINQQTGHRRRVSWKAHLPRTNFSQSALHEIGSALTLFQVNNNADEFLAGFAGEMHEAASEDDETTELVSEQLAENTRDYVLKRLKSELTDYEFEHFVAKLLEAMGYHARVTQKSGDGGVDVIAHRDELGFEPPLIKVQCKQTFSTIGRPDVQKLDGSIMQGEFGLFVTLGRYSSDAVTYDQMKPNLRLIDGPGLADLIYEHYSNFSPATQRLIPLRQVYVPGPQLNFD